MTDLLPPPDPPPDATGDGPEGAHPERVRASDPAPPRKRRDPLPLLFAIGFIVLVAAVFYLWQHPLGQHLFSENTGTPAEQGTAAAPTPATAAQLAALQQQVESMQREIVVARQGTEAARQDAQAARQQAEAAQQAVQAGRQQADTAQQQMAMLAQRVDALEHRPAPPQPDLAPLEGRIAALEKRSGQPPELAGLSARVDSLAGRLDRLADQQGQLANQQQYLTDQRQQLAGQIQGDETAQTRRLDALEARIAAVEQQAGKVSGLADRAGRIARIQAAEAALDAGLPVGDLPDAPPALARFANSAPPTPASLRLAFPAAARDAETAAATESGGAERAGFWDAVGERLRSLITVRRGDRVIVGNRVDGAIASASHALDAGDLAGAVAAVSRLHGAPAQAFAAWRTQAESLLEARRALASLAARA
jgi:predicted  nucleic acid-binding Zn-ribbon protein